MKNLTINGMELDVSDEFHKEKDFDMGIDIYLDSVLKCVFDEKLYKDYYDEYSKKSGLSGIGFLLAHGDADSNWGWKYIDEKKKKSVQSWINQNDGKHAGLVLICCNPNTKEIYSKKSLVFVPDRQFSLIAFNANMVKYEMYAPKKGYVSSYTLEYDLNQLKNEKI